MLLELNMHIQVIPQSAPESPWRQHPHTPQVESFVEISNTTEGDKGVFDHRYVCSLEALVNTGITQA